MADHPTTNPTGDHPTTDWSATPARVRDLRATADRAFNLAAGEVAAEVTGRRPGRLRNWLNRHRAHRHTPPATTTRPDAPTTPARTGGDRLRLIPPIAALGTAFVVQVVAVTDLVGSAAAKAAGASNLGLLAEHMWIGYLAALLLGLAVASCAEGGAAYLMDLYDKHLLSRDSVGILRLGMLVYVAASAYAIHWWADYRQLPGQLSWLLAAMSGSALFLWSRGSRWRHRVEMVKAGALDPALPRLSLAAKVLHPLRWLATLALISWEPVATTDEARARYADWRQQRAERKAAKSTAQTTWNTEAAADWPEVVAWLSGDLADGRPTLPIIPAAVPVATPTGRPRPAPVRPTTRRTTRPTASRPVRLVHGPLAVQDAAWLRSTYGDHPPGRNELHRTRGGNAERWTKALRAHADRADQTTQPTGRESADDTDQERSA